MCGGFSENRPVIVVSIAETSWRRGAGSALSLSLLLRVLFGCELLVPSWESGTLSADDGMWEGVGRGGVSRDDGAGSLLDVCVNGDDGCKGCDAR